MHPVTVIVFAEELLLLCGVVCAATPTDRIMAAAADAPDRTIVFMLPPLFQEPSGMGATLRPDEYGGAMYARGPDRPREVVGVDIPNLSGLRGPLSQHLAIAHQLWRHHHVRCEQSNAARDPF